MKTLFRNYSDFGIKQCAMGVFRDKEHDKGVGVIEGFAVMRKGFVKDCRAWEIDDVTLDKVVEEGNRLKLGAKDRFGHPGMSSQALGTFIGRAKQFRRDGDIVRADLYIDKTAYNTPQGDLGTYVLDLAENDPEAFGSSIVFDYALEYRLEKDGTKQKDPKTKKDLPPLLRIKKLFAVDTVDDPAATDGMFSRYTDSVKLSAEATAVLDKLLTSPDAEESIVGFLNRYFANRIQIDDENNINDNRNLTKEDQMALEVKDVSVEMLEKENPKVAEELKKKGENAGLEVGVQTERERVNGILAAAKPYPDCGELVSVAVKDGLSVDKATVSFQKHKLDLLTKKAPVSPGPNDAELENSKEPSHREKARAYAKENKCSITDALMATAPVRK